MYNAIRDALDGDEFSVVESFKIPGRAACYQKIPPFLYDSGVGNYLTNWSSVDGSAQNRLWSHQAQALTALGQGKNVVVATGTASGKSLIFRALALHKAMLDPASKTVVFYPLRALVEDQLRGWREMAGGLGFTKGHIGRIDGSVPTKDREAILNEARIVVMTPDVCQAWLMSRLATPVVRRYVASLSTLVMDEAHTLEGVFGSNFAFLVRRLIAARNHLLKDEDQAPPLQLIAATATISNPDEHMKRLTGASFTAIEHDADTAQSHERIVAHVECPEGEELSIARELHQRALTKGGEGSFISFLDSRKGVEAMAMATQQQLDALSENPEVSSYRSGFTAVERRRIERGLKSGELRGVVSTSALELGIDFPNLRVGFSVGLPPTRKAYRQRLGRVGRNSPGVFVIIGPSNLFQRFGTTLREYHEMSVEPSYLYLDNRFMQFAHGRCLNDEREALKAPKKLPTRVGWPGGFSDAYAAARPGGSRPTEFDAIAELGGDAPHYNYPLRNVGEITLEIKSHEDAPTLGDATQSQALRECYPGAVYYHMMKPYKVIAWRDFASRPYIHVRGTSPGSATRPQITTWINSGITATELIDGHLLRGDNGFLAECRMHITERVNGYFNNKTGDFHSYQELQQRDPNMKPRSRNFRTSGVVLCIDQDWFKNKQVKELVADRLREVFAHEYSVLPQDVGSSAANIAVRDGNGATPQGGCVAVFDQTYGSLRLTEKLYLEFSHILDRLAVAAKSEDGIDGFESIVAKMQDEVAGFSSQHPVEISGLDAPKGFEQVFAVGSRVCYRRQGTIAVDVEIIQPTIMNGELMYQIRADSQTRGEPPVIHWITATAVEPSAEVDAWQYAWWNRQTQTYEDPPEG